MYSSHPIGGSRKRAEVQPAGDQQSGEKNQPIQFGHFDFCVQSGCSRMEDRLGLAIIRRQLLMNLQNRISVLQLLVGARVREHCFVVPASASLKAGLRTAARRNRHGNHDPW
jgi:hypothetical protein